MMNVAGNTSQAVAVNESNFSRGKCASIWLNRLTFITKVVRFCLAIKTYRFSVNILHFFYSFILFWTGMSTIIYLNASY